MRVPVIGLLSVFAALALAGSCAQAAPAARGMPKLACSAKAVGAPANTTLVSVKALLAPVAHCRFEGFVNAAGPGSAKVRFVLAAPQQWSGRFLFTAPAAVAFRAASVVAEAAAQPLRYGFAVASTDTDTHAAAMATQALAKRYYGRETFNRYVTGCSAGGDGVLTLAQTNPEDFDGYVAGGGDYGSASNVAAIARRVNQVPDAGIAPDEFIRIQAALMARYDGADSAVDGLIWNGRVIRLDGADRKAMAFLSDAQWETLKLIAAPVRDAGGAVTAPGFWLTNPKLFADSLTGPDLAPTGDVAGGAAAGRLDPGALGALGTSGHKLVHWTGAADPVVSPELVLGYADGAWKSFGSQTWGFYRAFVIPGLAHCQGGEGAPTDAADKALEAAVAWVETGLPPEALNLSAAGAGQPSRTFRVCPWPQRSVFTGGARNSKRLDVNDARNWVCKS